MANTEKSAPTKLFFSPTKFAPGIQHGDKTNSGGNDTTFENSSDYAGNKSAYKPKNEMNIKNAGTQPHYRSGGGFGKSKTPKLSTTSTTSTTTSNTYKPFKMKFQGGNAIHGNFPESFKLSDATKPSTSQNPGGPPFMGLIKGLMGGGKKEDDSAADYKSPNKGIMDLVTKGKEVFEKVKTVADPIIKTVKKIFKPKDDTTASNDNTDKESNTSYVKRPKVSKGTA